MLPDSFRFLLARLLGEPGILGSSPCDLGLSGHFLVHRLTLISSPLIQTDPGEPSGLTVNLGQAPENVKAAHKLQFLLRQVAGSEPEHARVSGGSFSALTSPERRKEEFASERQLCQRAAGRAFVVCLVPALLVS